MAALVQAEFEVLIYMVVLLILDYCIIICLAPNIIIYIKTSVIEYTN